MNQPIIFCSETTIALLQTVNQNRWAGQQGS